MRVLTASLLALILAACSTQGTHIEAERATTIQSEVATAEELQEALGSPSVTIPTAGGKIKWVYEGVRSTPDVTQFIPYLNYAIGQTNQKCSKLTVLVDKEDGKLSDWNYSQEEDSDYWANSDESCRND